MENTSRNRFNKRNNNDRRAPVVEINVQQVLNFLSRQFKQKTEHMGRDAVRGTELHKLQTDFAYLQDEIKRGPTYQVSKVIAETNEFLDNIQQP